MHSRIQHVQKLLVEQSLDAILISSAINTVYLSGYNGFCNEERDAYILITRDTGYIFTSLLYAEAMESAVPHLKLVEFTRQHPFSQGLETLLKKHGIKTIGFEADDLTVREYQRLEAQKVKLQPADVSFLRADKEPQEVALMKKACKLTDVAFDYILEELKPGVTELEIEKKIARYFTEHQAESSFRAVVAFGKKTTVPHHLPGNTKLKANDVILIDYGARVGGYCADVSRTLFIGKATAKQKEIFHLVYDTQQASINYIKDLLKTNKPILSNVVDQFAREYIATRNYPPFPYSLGHGVGLKTHERPILNPRFQDEIKNNMTFTLEPGIHLSGEIGVRIEDVFLIQNNKLLQLSKSNSKLIEL